MPPLARGLIPDVQQRGYRAYPLVDHVADKVAATYQRYGKASRPSTRFRDLVDLVAIAAAASIEARGQRAALQSEFARRMLLLPEAFEAPDRDLWVPGYAKEARRSNLAGNRTLDDALAAVRPFLDPLLAGTASGVWDPSSRRWVDSAFSFRDS